MPADDTGHQPPHRWGLRRFFVLSVVSGQPRWFVRGVAGLAFLILLLSVEVAPLPPVAVGLAAAVALRSPGPGATPARLFAVGLVAAIPLIAQLGTGLDASDGEFYAAALGALPAVGLADAVTSHRLRGRTRAG